jgi:hypothetical protein
VANQPHIVEIYNLTRSVKTSHIEEFLLGFMWGGTTANVKWVDDEHALAVFPCAEAAQVLLDSSQKEFKVRPYNKASGAALQIAAEGEAGTVVCWCAVRQLTEVCAGILHWEPLELHLKLKWSLPSCGSIAYKCIYNLPIVFGCMSVMLLLQSCCRLAWHGPRRPQQWHGG